MPTFAPVVIRGVAMLLIACKAKPAASPAHEHAPVDPSLDLAIVVPPTLKSMSIGSLIVARQRTGLDAAAWVAEVRATNRSYTVDEAQPAGDGLMTTLRGRDGVRLWYRPSVGVECGSSILPDDKVRATCSGIQRLADGLYVPLAYGKLVLAISLDNEPHGTSAAIDAADSEESRMLVAASATNVTRLRTASEARPSPP